MDIWQLHRTKNYRRSLVYLSDSQKCKYSPNDWTRMISSKTQLNTLIALDQFWNVHSNNILRHLFSMDLTKMNEFWKLMNESENFPGNSVSFWLRPQVILLCRYIQMIQYQILQQFQTIPKAVCNWIQEHDNQITHLGLSGCPPPWQSLLYTLSSAQDYGTFVPSSA